MYLSPKQMFLYWLSGALDAKSLTEASIDWFAVEFDRVRTGRFDALGPAVMTRWSQMRCEFYDDWDTMPYYLAIALRYRGAMAKVEDKINSSDFDPESNQLDVQKFVTGIIGDFAALASLHVDFATKIRLGQQIQKGGYLKYYSLVNMTLLNLS